MDLKSLRHLARWYGVYDSYVDVAGQRCLTPPDTLLAVLRLLGAPVDAQADLGDVLRAQRQEHTRRLLDPVTVLWEDGPAEVLIRASAADGQAFRWRLRQETGEVHEFAGCLEELAVVAVRSREGVAVSYRRLAISPRPPIGYHSLELEVGSQHAEALLIAAPRRAYSRSPVDTRAMWGVFLPLYALHTESSWGAADFSDLETLMTWVAERGGSLVATLPLLSTLWEASDDPSPYSPASRLFWNEFYIDVARVHGFAECPAAREMIASGAVEEARTELRRGALVDYQGQMALKRRVLLALAEWYFDQPDHGDGLAEYLRTHPEADTFARFRAAGERQGTNWPQWPAAMRAGTITRADYDERIYRYHLFVQWQIEEQLRGLAAKAADADLLWYLDFPLGVGGASYDVWRWPELFATGASGGAPPDAFFTKGQNWGFPPLHPHRLREQGYAYLIAALRRHLTYARLLRIDHIMKLRRLYWIPHGMDAKEGAYVRYPMEELFAILCVESHRRQAWVIGENLGTVPAVLNEALARHGISDMYVVQYEARPEAQPPLPPVPATAVASVNTHDMPQFAAFWNEHDIEERVALGLLSEEESQEHRRRREVLRRSLVAMLRGAGALAEETCETGRVLEALLVWLGRSPAPVVLANLEDLWQETEAQNTPGTFRERPNWRRRARFAFEEFRERPEVVEVLGRLARARHGVEARENRH